MKQQRDEVQSAQTRHQIRTIETVPTKLGKGNEDTLYREILADVAQVRFRHDDACLSKESTERSEVGVEEETPIVRLTCSPDLEHELRDLDM